LVDHRAAWDALASDAIEPNCFYESWMLLPAIEHFGHAVGLEFALVYRTAAGQPRRLCGLFPFERRRGLHGLPVRLLRLWQHLHCFLGTPLVHRDWSRGVLAALFDWAGSAHNGAALLELPMTGCDGLFAQALIDVIQARQLLTSTSSISIAPSCVPAWMPRLISKPHWDRNIDANCSACGASGRLGPAYLARCWNPTTDPEPWIEQFLQLEASGWKGTQQTALNCAGSERLYFTAIAPCGTRARPAHDAGPISRRSAAGTQMQLPCGPGRILLQNRLRRTL